MPSALYSLCGTNVTVYKQLQDLNFHLKLYNPTDSHFAARINILNKHILIVFRLICSFFVDSQLSRPCTARGTVRGFLQLSDTKIEARKSFLFTESSLVLKI